MSKTFSMISTASQQTGTDPTQFYEYWEIYVSPSANRTGQCIKSGIYAVGLGEGRKGVVEVVGGGGVEVIG